MFLFPVAPFLALPPALWSVRLTVLDVLACSVCLVSLAVLFRSVVCPLCGLSHFGGGRTHPRHTQLLASWGLLACFCYVGEGSLTGSPGAGDTELSALPSAAFAPPLGQKEFQIDGIFLRTVASDTLISSRKRRKEIGVSLSGLPDSSCTAVSSLVRPRSEEEHVRVCAFSWFL